MSPIAPGQLPAELVNLLALHSSFLTALSLHYAHNGTSTPADLRDLTASTTLVWRQRKVTYDDVRLLIGVLDNGPSGKDNPYYLSDYGHGKICIEIKDNSPLMGGMTHMNEEGLQDMFKEGLDSLWSQWTISQKMANRPIAMPKRGRGRPKRVDIQQTRLESFLDDSSISKFLSQLPLADITTCASLTALAPLQEKGRKRLREFKESVQQGRAQKKTRQIAGKENEPFPGQDQPAQPVQAKITEFAAVRKTNLLDRILAKQEAAKAGPVAPSPAELQRRAALQRTPEVMGVLSLLCANRPGARVSFSTTILLQSLQGSIRSPISKEEAMKTIEVLANEVAPGYVSVISMGAISSVVINQAMRPTDIKSRLVALGA
ncbi:Nn.00g027450.m01.CDS01 [Neocucurbitaria sp. VM-36]